MMLVRSAQEKDVDTIFELAEESGVGITTLPKTKEALRKLIKLSLASFAKTLNKPHNEYYLFVLEDLKREKVIGTSAIKARTGDDGPFYSYKISKCTRFCSSLNIRQQYDLLHLSYDKQEHTELCTLFLHSHYRKHHDGLLLSKSRFLFMAEQPNRFKPNVIAELRGVSSRTGISPFWEDVGSKFFNISFQEADAMTSINKQFIADLMPKKPIYVPLLTAKAQAVIGKAHQCSMPALNILQKEGFSYKGYVDIFDAGPTIEAPLNNIRTIAMSHKLKITSINEHLGDELFLIANTAADFRSTISHALIDRQKNTCAINSHTAELLQVTKGQSLRIAPAILPKL